MSDRYHIKYKWEDPYDWLTDQWSLPVPVLELIRMKMNFDDIQDEFQEEMTETGYFDPICPFCDDKMDELETGQWFCSTCDATFDKINVSQGPSEELYLVEREPDEEAESD